MSKKVSFGAKPQAAAQQNPDDWVSSGGSSNGTSSPAGAASAAAAAVEQQQAARGITKRLTFDISVDLHTRVKVQCARKGVKVADELRLLLEEHFPPEGEERTT